MSKQQRTAWKKLFGGLAVPRPVDLSRVESKLHHSSARGARPNTFGKGKPK